MSATGEEIKIDLDELDAKKAAVGKEGEKKTETPVKTDTEIKTDAAAVITPDEGLEKLKKQLDDERARADLAEHRAREATADAARAKSEVKGSQLETVKGAIAALNTANDALEKQSADLMSAQDFAGAAKIQREMGKNEAKLLQLDNAKTHLERQAKEPVAPAPGDPVEDLAAQLTPRSAAWVRAHPEFARDNAKYAQMIDAHNLVTHRGIKSDTDAYFAAIEKVLEISPVTKVTNGSGEGEGEHNETKIEDPMSEAAKPAAKKAAPASAPVSRSGNGTGTRTNVITLSPEEVEIAKLNGQTPEEYARNKAALKKEGRLN